MPADEAQPDDPWARCWWRHRAGEVPNSMGKLVGPLSPGNGFHGAGPTRRRFGSR